MYNTIWCRGRVNSWRNSLGCRDCYRKPPWIHLIADLKSKLSPSTKESTFYHQKIFNTQSRFLHSTKRSRSYSPEELRRRQAAYWYQIELHLVEVGPPTSSSIFRPVSLSLIQRFRGIFWRPVSWQRQKRVCAKKEKETFLNSIILFLANLLYAVYKISVSSDMALFLQPRYTAMSFPNSHCYARCDWKIRRSGSCQLALTQLVWAFPFCFVHDT